ncbi:hypothetical protein HYV80_05350 [Candidatus Woesearchaeota archaeon]|nr:hypothetical protein [Candidatus Woesearchaeota archaeon]
MKAYKGLRLITHQDLVGMIAGKSRGSDNPMQSELYSTPRYSGTLKTPEDFKLNLARMGTGGDGAYAALILLATKSPEGLSTYLPDDNPSRGLQQSLPVPDFSREQSKLQQGISQTNPNTGKREKEYHRNVYSYAKYAGVGYLKSAAKAVYGKVGDEVRNAMAKIRGVYQSSKGFLRRNRTYAGQSNASNVVSLDAYRAARENKRYAAQNPSSGTLEEKVA